MTGKTVVVSGSGNVAIYAVEKATQLNAKVVTMSDSSGFIYDQEGISPEKLAYIMDIKEVRRGRIKEYLDKYPNAEYHEGKNPWGIKCDIALPAPRKTKFRKKMQKC